MNNFKLTIRLTQFREFLSIYSQMAGQDIICSNLCTQILTYSYGVSKYFLHICASNVLNFFKFLTRWNNQGIGNVLILFTILIWLCNA
jgi:hypothetical protein